MIFYELTYIIPENLLRGVVIMINLEVFRLELNYLQQVVGKELGNKDARKLSEAITGLVTCFLNPATYYSLSLSYIQTIEQYIKQIQ